MPATVYDYDARIDTTGFDLERVISEPIQLLEATDAPLLEIIGGLNGASNWGFNNTPGTKVEWMQEEYNNLSAVVNGAKIAADTAIVVVDASTIQPRSILRVPATGELLWVSAVNTTTNTLTVTRAWGGAIAAGAVADEAVLQMVGIAKLEADTYHMGHSNLPWSAYNYSQIWERSFGMSGTAREVPGQIVGIRDPWNREKVRAIRDVMKLIDNALHYGVRSADRGTASSPRTMGGYPQFITTNVDATGTLTLDKLNAMCTKVVDYGATAPVVIAGPVQYKTIKGFLTALTGITVPYTQTSIGMQVTEIDADFGVLKIMKNIRQPNSLLPIFNLPDLGMLTIRPLKEEDMPKTADRYQHSVLGEYTFCLRNEKRFALFTGLPLS